MTGLPLARASAPACCKASAAFTVKRSGLIMARAYFATSVPAERCRNGGHQVKNDRARPQLSEGEGHGDTGPAGLADPGAHARARLRARSVGETVDAEQRRRGADTGVHEPERTPRARLVQVGCTGPHGGDAAGDA